MRSESVGDILVEGSRKFWGGAAGWDDPDILICSRSSADEKGGPGNGREEAGGGGEEAGGDRLDEAPADVDALEVEFVAEESQMRLSIVVRPAVKGQEIHIQMAELVQLTATPVVHPRALDSEDTHVDCRDRLLRELFVDDSVRDKALELAVATAPSPAPKHAHRQASHPAQQRHGDALHLSTAAPASPAAAPASPAAAAAAAAGGEADAARRYSSAAG